MAESVNPLLHAIHFRALLNFARAVVRAQHDSGAIVGNPGNYPETEFWEMRQGPPAINFRRNEDSNNQADGAPSLAVAR